MRHSELGEVRGIEHAKVVEYRGIQYATLKNKFADAIMTAGQPAKGIDATRTGPCASCPPAACDMEYMFIQHSLPREQFEFSDTECLNMNIVCPREAPSGLPVLVFVHGGGFGIGSNAWPQYDLKRLVEQSIELSSPMIGIGINYRLGINGFLTSDSLEKAGYKPNRGLRDQRVAFEWVQQHITGFGGDPERVTAMAESAGAVGLTYLLQCRKRLFSQFISMSGTPLLMKPLTAEFAESQYQNVLQVLGLTSLSSDEVVDRLLQMQTLDMMQQIPPSVALVPIHDNDTVMAAASFGDWQTSKGFAVDGDGWCSRILIGDCAFDAHIIYYMLPPPSLENIEKDFIEFATKTLHKRPHAVEKLFKTYGMTGESGWAGLVRVLDFAQDIGFDAPVRALADAWAGDAYVYYFNETNPWPGKFQGKSGHVLDIAFLCQNYTEYLSEEQIRSSREMGKNFIAFINGQEPFAPWRSGKGGAMVYGLQRSGHVEYADGVDAGVYDRRAGIFELAKEIDLDELSSVWDQFRASR